MSVLTWASQRPDLLPIIRAPIKTRVTPDKQHPQHEGARDQGAAANLRQGVRGVAARRASASACAARHGVRRRVRRVLQPHVHVHQVQHVLDDVHGGGLLAVVRRVHHELRSLREARRAHDGALPVDRGLLVDLARVLRGLPDGARGCKRDHLHESGHDLLLRTYPPLSPTLCDSARHPLMSNSESCSYLNALQGACLLHEKIDVPSLMCALISFAGLVCVVRPGFLFGYDHPTADVNGSWIAIGSALLGAIGQTFVFITVRKLRDANVLVIVHYFMLFSIALSLLYIAIVQRAFVIPSDITLWGTVIGSGVFTFFGQMFLTKGFQLEKAGIASVMRYLDVVCVFIWDAVLLRERINHWSIVGAAIICTCAVVIALRKSKTAQ